MLGRVELGSVVRVVLQGRNMRAFVVAMLDEPAVVKVRSLSSLVSPEPLFTTETIALAEWTARRYIAPLGSVLHDAVPGRFSTKAPTEDLAEDLAEGLATSGYRVPPPKWLKGDLPRVIAHAGAACVVLPSALTEPEFIAYAVSEAREAGVSTLVISPRVDLAEELGRAVPACVVLHGDDRPSDRAAAWAAARDGRTDVVVGGRSALFVPLRNLGLIVVASAHDRSLKSERAPRLHGLVVARRRAKMAGAAFVASSPAPPLEVADAELLESRRARVKPQVARPRKGPVTPRMVEAVRAAIDSGRDALVFVGRLGGVLRLRCIDCAFTPACQNCGTGLALGPEALWCRVCGTTAPVPDVCSSCGGALSERGWGHDRVARTLERSDVGAPVVRMVRGTDIAGRPKPSVVVGTLAAAHVMSDVGTVVVADLDQLLTRPDFRAAEYALQTLHELAGVVAPDGRFLVQTREPEHHVVQAFTRGSYAYFLDRELPFRKETGYPPFGAVVRVELDVTLFDELRRDLGQTDALVVGAVARKGRLVALVRGPQLEPLLDPLRRFTLEHPRTKIDIDPVDLS